MVLLPWHATKVTLPHFWGWNPKPGLPGVAYIQVVNTQVCNTCWCPLRASYLEKLCQILCQPLVGVFTYAYSRSDLHRHWLRSKRSASAVGLRERVNRLLIFSPSVRAMVPPRGLEPQLAEFATLYPILRTVAYQSSSTILLSTQTPERLA